MFWVRRLYFFLVYLDLSSQSTLTDTLLPSCAYRVESVLILPAGAVTTSAAYCFPLSRGYFSHRCASDMHIIYLSNLVLPD